MSVTWVTLGILRLSTVVLNGVLSRHITRVKLLADLRRTEWMTFAELSIKDWVARHALLCGRINYRPPFSPPPVLLHSHEARVLMQRLSYSTDKPTRNRIVLSFKDSPRKPLGRRPMNARTAAHTLFWHGLFMPVLALSFATAALPPTGIRRKSSLLWGRRLQSVRTRII